MASIERRSGARGDVYVVRFRDVDGRQRSKSFQRHVDALHYSRKVEVQLADGEWIDPRRARETFGAFHARWFAARDVSRARMSTEAGQARNHILPRWEKVPLGRIRPLDVDAWVKDMDASAYVKHGCLQQFRACLKAAVREGILRANPAAETKPPKLPRKRVTSADVLSPEELARLVAATPEQWQPLVYLSGWLGWRWSEAMGLRVRDVDLEAGIVYVGNRVAVEVGGVIEVRDGGKTSAATRTVPLPQPAVRALRGLVERRSSVGGPDAPVFVTESGTTPLRSNFSRIFQRAVKDAGLEGRGLNVRQLRHTAATLMLAAGLDVLDVQQRLGHANGSITLDVYGRVLAGRRTSGTERMAAVMNDVAVQPLLAS